MKPSIIPKPAHLKFIPGCFEIQPDTRILACPEAVASAEFLQKLLRPATGFHLPVEAGNPGIPLDGNILLTKADPAHLLCTEGYEIEVNEQAVVLRAADSAGFLYAVQSIRQLLPPEIETQSLVKDILWQIPSIKINDSPRFPWRGLHLDVGRYYFPVNFIKRFIDLMALFKMNTFHWHLTEDQGWRIEIKKYPKLIEVGSRRSATPFPADRGMLDGHSYIGYYTQEQIQEVVAYAAQRCITVVPEIEMPGHACAALASYPELGCTGGPYQVRTFWGVEDDVFCAGNEQVFTFLEDVLGEVLELFPGPFIHIGGDECPKVRWAACPKCQARIQQEGLKDEHELQSYFIRRIERFLNSKSRRLIGWDEILEGGLAPGATVMSWRGIEGGIEAAREGHDVVMSPTDNCYLDYYQSDDYEKEPPAIGGVLTLETVYEYEPVPQALTPNQAIHVLGAQGNVWSEYIPTPALVEYMAYPRACALAEVTWSPAEARDWIDFNQRLKEQLKRLDQLGVNYRKLNY